MTIVYDPAHVRSELTRYITEHGRATTAKACGCSISLLYKVQSGAAEPTGKVLKVLNMELAIVARGAKGEG